MSMEKTLSILGTGIYLPPAHPVREMAAAAGADVSNYQGWPKVCHAREDDQPSTMGATALRAALTEAGVAPEELRLVLFAGISRDYLPSFSVATEIMQACGAQGRCLGLDMTIGCMGALSALDMAQGWLSLHGGGVAAIVTAERWSYTVDHGSVASMGLWAHGDGAGAAVVSLGTRHGAKAIFHGAEFTTQSDLNGTVLVKYGGTRHPVAPAGANPAERLFMGTSRADIRERYAYGYSSSLEAMKKRFGVSPNRVIINQTAALFLHMIAQVIGIPIEYFLLTGPETGHVGSADLLIGLDRMLKSGPFHEPYLLASSTPYAFGAGLLTPPAPG
ncbi:MAG: ketoacyl-ACP synthase III family protein [Gammaproteobacteria bacterium]|nr:ketoacyl-ACP synthase III family protein [Gammaproteobacteria bacterium]